MEQKVGIHDKCGGDIYSCHDLPGWECEKCGEFWSDEENWPDD